MKRCPHCNRVESDDALVFCRADGTALVNDYSPLNSESGTMQFGSTAQSSEVGTNILSHATNADVSRGTGPTTVLSVQQVGSIGYSPYLAECPNSLSFRFTIVIIWTKK